MSWLIFFLFLLCRLSSVVSCTKFMQFCTFSQCLIIFYSINIFSDFFFFFVPVSTSDFHCHFRCQRHTTEQWYFKFRNWRSIMVRSEWLWLCANISDKHNIRGSISTGSTWIRGWMPAWMVHRGNYTVGGAIMFGGNKKTKYISIYFESGKFSVKLIVGNLIFFIFGRLELGTGSDWLDVHCSRFLWRRWPM